MPKPQLKTPADWLWYLFCGGCMGAADVVPGVSGGTMAFILGYYEDLINNVKNINFKVISLFFRLQFRELSEHIAWEFLAVIIVGTLGAIAALSQVITYLLNDEVYRVYLYSGFLGLILASVIFCARKVEVWSKQCVTALILGAGVAFLVTNFTLPSHKEAVYYDVSIPLDFGGTKEISNYQEGKLVGVKSSELAAMLAKGYVQYDTVIVNTLTAQSTSVGDIVESPSYPIVLPWIVFCGAIAISAMLLPGISGSYLLTILGTYPIVIGALADLTYGLKDFHLDWDAVILLSNLLVGILFGGAFFSRVISWLFTHYYHATISLLVGFMVGALKSVWPFWTYTYQLLPLKLDNGPKLISVSPILPEIHLPLLWTALSITIVAFVSVFCIELIALRKPQPKK
ncbi:MAG: DUF368 domain-containing protein [Chlamydiota bacterium]